MGTRLPDYPYLLAREVAPFVEVIDLRADIRIAYIRLGKPDHCVGEILSAPDSIPLLMIKPVRSVCRRGY